MMNSKTRNLACIYGYVFFMVAFFFMSACTSLPEGKGSNENSTNDAKKDMDQARADLNQARVDYINKYETFRNESNDKIAESKKNIAMLRENKSISKAARVELDEWLTILENKNEELSVAINRYQYKEDGNEKWESFKVEFIHDMETLGTALEDLTRNNIK